MQEEISKELLKRADVIGDWLAGKITAVADTATAQAVDIAMQYVMFGRAYQTIIVILCFIGAYCVWRIASNKTLVDHSDGASYSILLFNLIPLVVFFSNLKSTIMVWFAPKVWLMIEIADLIDKTKAGQ